MTYTYALSFGWLVVWLAIALVAALAFVIQYRRIKHRELTAHADQQHRWIQSGDPRGIYGMYPPADL